MSTDGLDVSGLAPADAAVALRSYARRFRAALTSIDPDDGDPDDVARRAGPDGRSALDHAVHAARTFALLDRALEQALTAESPVVHPAVGDPTQREWDSTSTAGVDDALTELAGAANAMADRVDHVPADDWRRTVSVPGGGSIAAIDLVRDAVRTGHDDLRAAERALAAG